MLESIDIEDLQENVLDLAQTYLMSVDVMVQLGIILCGLFAGLIVRKYALPILQKPIDNLKIHYRTKNILRNACRLIMQVATIIIILIGAQIAASDIAGNIDTALANATVALLLAWVVIRLVVQLIDNRFIRNVFALTIWVLAALAILGILDETAAALDAIGMDIGEFRISALSVIKSLFALFILLYGAIFLSRFLENKIQSASSLTISSRVLLAKIIRVTLVTFALLIAVTAAGIDLSLFAIFSGALGLGVGFGLQKGISNLFSGMLLLMDKSIKPGDVIELPGVDGEGAFGWVQHMGARYTEIVTRDNKSYLIPNEDFITKQITNWSHGDTLIRVEVKFGVSYKHNPHHVKEITEQAAMKAHDRICKDPAAVCHLVAFGDSSLDFRLRFWIRDAEKGVTNMRAAVMLALWDAFQEHNIEIPYPHREVYIHEPQKKRYRHD